MNKQFKGIWPVVPTPFLNDGSVDYEGMRMKCEEYRIAAAEVPAL